MHTFLSVLFGSLCVYALLLNLSTYQYCLFGDAVNTASRMESNSEANRINCSKSSAKLLLEQYPELPLRSRGELNIKGKGMMACYWVNESIGSAESTSNAVERVHALQQRRLTGQMKKEARQEQALTSLEEASVEFGSADFQKLDEQIKERLGRGDNNSSF